MKLSLTDLFLALLVILLWGLSFVVIKVGLTQLPPFLFSGLRFFIVAIPAILFIPFPKKHWKAVLGIGIFLGIFKFSFLFLSLDGHLTSGFASLLLQSQVFFTIFLAVLVFRESVTRVQIKGLIISMLGFVILLSSNSQSFTLSGLFFIFMAGVSWAVSNLIMKSIGQVNLFQLMVWACAIPPIPMFVVSYFTESVEPLFLLESLDLKGWISVFFLSYCSTLLAYAIWGSLLRKYTATTVTPLALLIPIVGLLSSNLMMGEKLNPVEVFTFLLILLGLAVGIIGNILTTYKTILKGTCLTNFRE